MAAAAIVIAGAGVARVYRGAHWPRDVGGGLLLGAASLMVLWAYRRLTAGSIRLLGVEFIVSNRQR
ncbi:MAG: phosphatase PAP2 family protein [Chloroflexi bacterium]|nr:phosphatase PAP2 family protein [Chloroflexota bacterium]